MVYHLSPSSVGRNCSVLERINVKAGCYLITDGTDYLDTASFRIKLHISHISQTSAVADINHFFFFKSKMRTEPPHFFLVYSMRILIIWFHPEIITETALYQRKTAAALQPDSPANQIPAPASEEPQEYRFQMLLRILKFLQTEKVPT